MYPHFSYIDIEELIQTQDHDAPRANPKLGKHVCLFIFTLKQYIYRNNGHKTQKYICRIVIFMQLSICKWLWISSHIRIHITLHIAPHKVLNMGKVYRAP